MKQSTQNAMDVVVTSLDQTTLNNIGLFLIFDRPAEMKYLNDSIEVTTDFLQDTVRQIDEKFKKDNVNAKEKEIFLEIKDKAEARLLKMEQEANEE